MMAEIGIIVGLFIRVRLMPQDRTRIATLLRHEKGAK